MNHYNHAILRRPGTSFAGGITTAGLGAPRIELARRQHAAYRAALERCGVQLTVLPADEDYPDGCFVEDTAVLTPEVAVLTRPGDPTRRGETAAIAATLAGRLPIERLTDPARLDGGDVLRVGDHFYIGLSRRTDAEGAAQLSRILTRYGYTATTLPVREVLHLKTGVTYVGDDTFLAIAARAEWFAAHDTIVLPPAEAYAANCLRVNDYVLIPEGFPYAHRCLRERGYALIEVPMS